MKKIYLIILSLGFVQISSAQSDCPVIPADSDFGMCAMVLGIANVEGQGCVTLSGCGYTAADGIDYTSYFFQDEAACQDACLTDCNPIPSGISFGECDMYLGVAQDASGNCVPFSGCGYTGSDGVDYTGSFYQTTEECISACGENCIDPSLIDPNAFCPMIWAPVCGCDNVTYSNDCVATTQGGVTSYTEGECTVGVVEIARNIIRAFPNPASDYIQFNYPQGLQILRVEFISTDGKLALTLPYSAQIDIRPLAAGNYIIRATAANSSNVFETRFTKK